MKLIEKNVRDIVISIIESGTVPEKKIKCTLNGIDYNFAKKYYKFACFEKDFVDNERYYIERMQSLNKDNIYSLNLHLVDVRAQQLLEWNSSFGIRGGAYLPDIETQIDMEIPFEFYSEWTVEMLKSFDRMRSPNSIFSFKPTKEILKGGIAELFLKLIKDVK